jgi:hypothetical protein
MTQVMELNSCSNEYAQIVEVPELQKEFNGKKFPLVFGPHSGQQPTFYQLSTWLKSNRSQVMDLVRSHVSFTYMKDPF